VTAELSPSNDLRASIIRFLITGGPGALLQFPATNKDRNYSLAGNPELGSPEKRIDPGFCLIE